MKRVENAMVRDGLEIVDGCFIKKSFEGRRVEISKLARSSHIEKEPVWSFSLSLFDAAGSPIEMAIILGCVSAVLGKKLVPCRAAYCMKGIVRAAIMFPWW